MLNLLDTEGSPYGVSTPVQSFHNGVVGGAYDQLVYVRNTDPSKYYTSVQLLAENLGDYNDAGEWGTTGWGVKLIYGSRVPTELEWDAVDADSTLVLPDIGSTEAADTFTNHPVWVRVYCPGAEPAQIRESMQLKMRCVQREVGA